MSNEGYRFLTLDEVKSELGGHLLSPQKVDSSRSVLVAAMVVLVVFISSIFGMIFIPWVQTVQGSGRVVAYSPNDRQQNLEATVDGQIIGWNVLEGSRVKKGDVVVEISDIDPNFLERVELERDATLAKLTAAQKSLEASQRNLERQRALYQQGLSSRRAFELAEIEEAKFLGEVASASADVAKIETKLARQASQKVTAPRDGVVQRILRPQGGVLIKQGDLLAIIVPDTEDRAVELFIDGNDLPIVGIGKPVRLQFEGWPAIQFSGWPSVAVGTFGGKIAVIDPSDDGNGKFRVLIVPDANEPWPDTRYLRQGVRAVGWVMLDTVRLGWELWRRFNAFPLSSISAPPELQKEQSSNGTKAKT
jgi:multidrug efflux pump subunit AcrA (membrane-fusion protein)